MKQDKMQKNDPITLTEEACGAESILSDASSRSTETIPGALCEEKDLRTQNSRTWRMNNGTVKQVITFKGDGGGKEKYSAVNASALTKEVDEAQTFGAANSDPELFSANVFYRESYGAEPVFECSDDIQVACASGGAEYFTELTINKKKLPLYGSTAANVTLKLTQRSFYGTGYVEICGANFDSDDKLIAADITKAFNDSAETFKVVLKPLHNYFDASYYFSGANAPVLEVDYLENREPCKKRYALCNNAEGIYNVVTGETIFEFIDTSSDDFVLGGEITHIYKEDEKNFNCGNNFRLNLNEKLRKVTDNAMDADYVYTDAYGDNYGFKEYFYYIDQQNEKVYVNRTSVTAELDGSLWYNGIKVIKEERSVSGYKAVTLLEGVRNAEYCEQRQNEIKQLSEQVTAYENTISEFALVNRNDGTISYNFTVGNFESLYSSISYSLIVLTKSEAFNYRELISASSKPVTADAQKTYLTEKSNVYKQQLYGYYKEYLNKKSELESLKKQLPVNFLIKDDIIKGFNEYGNLTAIYDSYDNCMLIEYDKKNRICRVQDGNGKEINFKYNASGLLTSVTSPRGHRTVYTYNANNDLVSIKYRNGKETALTYTSARISSVRDGNEDFVTFAYDDNSKTETIKHYKYMQEISNGKHIYAVTPLLYLETNFTYGAGKTEITETGDITVKERYKYDSKSNITEYYLDKGGKVVQAEQYSYVPYESRAVFYTSRASLNKTPLESFVFQVEDTVNIALDEFNDIKSKTTINKTDVLAGAAGQRREREEKIDYTYNDDRKLIKERTHVSIKNHSVGNDESFYTVKLYDYNSQGKLIKTESYTENEEYSEGKAIEERVYDDKGNEIKSFVYNSLDPSSKLYTESDHAEDGKETAEIDETGENKTRIEYMDGTEIVRTKILPNGGKFAYGYDENGNVTAITQSTESGEENSTQISYTCGLPTKVKSGNTSAEYVYDHKGRVTSIKLDSDKPYIKYTYADKVTENGKTVNKITAVTANGYTEEKVTDTFGNTVKTMCKDILSGNAAGLMSTEYNERELPIKVIDEVSSEQTIIEYDSMDRIRKLTRGNVSEEYVYTSRGSVATKKSTVDGKRSITEYAYKNNAAKDLESITVDGIQVTPSRDVLGRNTGKEITVNGTKVTEEHISYRKHGDHATNMPSTIRFGNAVPIQNIEKSPTTHNTVSHVDSVALSHVNSSAVEKSSDTAEATETDALAIPTNIQIAVSSKVEKTVFVRQDVLKYKYDACNNISEVWENGTFAAKYTYDKLNRIVREDNKQFGKTTLFTYDNNGNILSKREFAFTLKETALLDEAVEAKYAHYNYSGDKLVLCGKERFKYDALGNPLIYRNKKCLWEKGRNLVNYNGIEFAYNGQGERTSKSANGATTNYTYDGSGNIVKQSDGENTLEYIYDHSGIM